MKKVYKFKLIGYVQPRYKSTMDPRKPRLKTEILHQLVIESELNLNDLKMNIYQYVPRVWNNRRNIESMYNLKIPIWIKKLKWKIEENE